MCTVEACEGCWIVSFKRSTAVPQHLCQLGMDSIPSVSNIVVGVRQMPRRTHFICLGSAAFHLNVTFAQLLQSTLYSTRIVCSSNCLALFSRPVGLFSKCTVWILWAGRPLNDENLLEWPEVMYSPVVTGPLCAVQVLYQYFSANTRSTKNIIIVTVIMMAWVRVVLWTFTVVNSVRLFLSLFVNACKLSVLCPFLHILKLDWECEGWMRMWGGLC